jgi:2-dehydro-3-deoxyglucarate aldolase
LVVAKMNRLTSIQSLRAKLNSGGYSVGGWMQIPHPSVAEIMGQALYDWVAVDMEHGAVSAHQLPDLFRALELGNTLPLARLASDQPKDCKQALDAGAGGVIVPMIESAEQLKSVRDACCWPPSGSRGVGFSRANLFGKHFDEYSKEAQRPFLVAMIEHERAAMDLDDILDVSGLDAILVGPYDLSASMGLTAQFDHPEFSSVMKRIRTLTAAKSIPAGVHVVEPSKEKLWQCIDDGHRFLAYSLDAVLLNSVVQFARD